MSLKTCLRCDWEGETKASTCPDCGGRSLFTVGPPERDPTRGADLPPTDQVETSLRPAWSAIAIVLALVAVISVGSWLERNAERPAEASSAEAPTAPPDSFDPAAIDPERRALIVNDLHASFTLPATGWEQQGSISVSGSTTGSRHAEAIVYLTDLARE